MSRHPANRQLYPGSNRENNGAIPRHLMPLYALPDRRRGAIDLTASGAVKSDYWHHGMPSQVVTRNFDRHPGIFFSPADGISRGVAMTECEYGQGIANPDVLCMDLLPPQLRNVRSGSMTITWPGYQTLKWERDIVFFDRNGCPLTMRQLGIQVARLWRDFYEGYHHQTNETIPVLRLGPNHITINHVRLHGIYTHNHGRLWQVETSYIFPN